MTAVGRVDAWEFGSRMCSRFGVMKKKKPCIYYVVVLDVVERARRL